MQQTTTYNIRTSSFTITDQLSLADVLKVLHPDEHEVEERHHPMEVGLQKLCL